MVGKSALWGAENEEEKEGVRMVVPPFTLSLNTLRYTLRVY